ncbi:MAG: hypothetical protein SCM11_05080 [Bacillota bacterium]|nr:hypothetical protein [Bacillota bacterium]
MTKGKYGLSLVAIAILAFVLAFFGLLEALILFLAFALILEKDQWLSRQVFQAFYLRLAYVILLTVIDWIFKVINAFFGLFSAFRVINFFNSVQSIIQFLLYVGLFAMALIAVLRLAKGKDAGLPLISSLVDKTFGIIKPKAKPQAQPQQAYQPPQAAPYQAPVPSAQVYQPPAAQAAPPPPAPAPVEEAVPQAAPAQEAPPSKTAEETTPAEAPPAPKADGSWTCSCGRENNSNFCMSCGKPRQS